MKNLIKKWLGIVDPIPEPQPFVFRVEHPDFIDQDITPEVQEAILHFFKMSKPGRVLMSNLYQDVNDLMQQASSTPDAQLRNYLISKAGGQREMLAKILKVCVVKEPKLQGNDPMTGDNLSAALGHDYEVGEESE